MDIRDVSTPVNDASRREKLVRVRSGSPDSGKVEGTPKEDFFEKSGKLGAVRALIDGLVQVPEIRTDVVERARSLLESGALDSRESAERAAEAFLEGGSVAAV